MATIKLIGISVETREIEIEESDYRAAVEEDRLDHELDTQLSDMYGETVVVDPDGTVVNPYGGTAVLVEIARPVLDQLPTWIVEQYAAHRRSEEE
jgi:hypothetical protein